MGVRWVKWRPVFAGAAGGAIAFFALRAWAQAGSLSVRDMHSNVKAYVGSEVTVAGIAHNIRSFTRTKNGRSAPWVRLDLYEVDPRKGTRGKYYVYVELPVSDFQSPPVEGQNVSVTGVPKWAYMIAQIIQD